MQFGNVFRYPGSLQHNPPQPHGKRPAQARVFRPLKADGQFPDQPPHLFRFPRPFQPHQLRDQTAAVQQLFRYLAFIQKKIVLPGLIALQRAAYRRQQFRHVPRGCPRTSSIVDNHREHRRQCLALAYRPGLDQILP